MHIQFQRSSPLEGVITIQLDQIDYKLIVSKKIKDYSRRIALKGFRPGHVPIQLIKKKLGPSILREEVCHIIQKSLYDYVKEHALNLFGNPIPLFNEDIDWEKETEFNFSFEIGLVAPISLEPIKENIEVTSYQIDSVETALIDTFIKKIQVQYAAIENVPEKSNISHVIQGYLGEITGSESHGKEIVSRKGIVDKDNTIEVMIPIFNLKQEHQKGFIGLSEGDQIIMSRSTLDTIHNEVISLIPSSLERFLITTKKELCFTVKKINKATLPTIDQAFFDKVFGSRLVYSEKAFREKLEEIIRKDAQRDADDLLDIVLQDLLLKNIPIALPDAFIKKVLQQMQSNLSHWEVERIKTEHVDFQNYIKWDVLLNKVLEVNKISVSYTEVLEYMQSLSSLDHLIRGDYESFMDFVGRRGDANIINSLEKEQARIYKRCYELLSTTKALQWIKDKITIEKCSISAGSFIQKKKDYMAFSLN